MIGNRKTDLWKGEGDLRIGERGARGKGRKKDQDVCVYQFPIINVGIMCCKHILIKKGKE